MFKTLLKCAVVGAAVYAVAKALQNRDVQRRADDLFNVVAGKLVQAWPFTTPEDATEDEPDDEGEPLEPASGFNSHSVHWTEEKAR